MKIAHIAPSAPYNEGWGYQENLLPKYQAQLGHKVWIIVKNQKFDNGLLIETKCESYTSKDGFQVIRKKEKCNKIKALLPFRHINVISILLRIKPDYVFFHGLGNITIFQVILYKLFINQKVIIIQDNHLDENIGYKKEGIYAIAWKSIYRLITFFSIRFIDKVYGVTPWRVDYAINYYGVPREKVSLLMMGADDEKLMVSIKGKSREKLRSKWSIKKGEFVIVTGGKLDSKKNIINLIKACGHIDDVKLIIFGTVLSDIEEEFNRLINNNKNIIFEGWVKSEKVYDYFLAADLIVFLGQHSVLWEQACASKKPCLFKLWNGMTHVNVCNNSSFIEDTSERGIIYSLKKLVFTEEYYKMKDNCTLKDMDVFLYSNIAKKSMEK